MTIVLRSREVIVFFTLFSFSVNYNVFKLERESDARIVFLKS